MTAISFRNAVFFACREAGCEAILYTRHHLNLHVRLVHRHACQTCGSEFETHDALALHRGAQSHDGLICMQCGIVVATSTAMGIHKRTAHATRATMASNTAERVLWLSNRFNQRAERPRKGILRQVCTNAKKSPAKRVTFGHDEERTILTCSEMRTLAHANQCRLLRKRASMGLDEDEAIELRIATKELFCTAHDEQNAAINDMFRDGPRTSLILAPSRSKRAQLARLADVATTQPIVESPSSEADEWPYPLTLA